MFSKIINSISTITLILILVGYYDLFVYYQKFGINISSFLDPTEILFAFSSIFQAIVTITGIFILGMFAVSIFDQKHVSENKQDEKPNIASIVYRFKKLRKITLIGILGIAIIFGSITFISTVLLKFRHVTDFILLIDCVSIIAVYWFTVKFFQIKSVLKVLESSSFKIDQITHKDIQIANFSNYDYAFIIIVTLLYFNVRSEVRYQNVITGFPKYSVHFETNDETDDKKELKELYIGSTRNYIFMYDSSTHEVMSYPEREVKFFKIKELRPGL